MVFNDRSWRREAKTYTDMASSVHDQAGALTQGTDLYGFMFSTPEIYGGDRELQCYFICYDQNALSAGRCVRPMKL